MERRNHNRSPIRLEAEIHDQSNHSWPFVIENFGQDGLYLTWPERSPLPDSIRVGDLLQAHFQISLQDKPQAYQLELKVIRILDKALAVNLYNPALAAMSELSKQQLQAGMHANVNLDHTLDKKSRMVLDTARQNFLQRLAHSTELFLPVVHDALFQLAETSKSNSDQALYFDSLNTLNKTKDDLKTQFLNLMTVELNRCSQGNFTKFLVSDQEQNQAEELDLIDQDEFENWLTVNQIIIKVSPRYEQQLLEIKMRLAYLFGYKPDDIETTPFAPQTIFKCFSETIHKYFLNNDILLILYRQFENLIDSHLFEMYKAVNQIFIDNNILPIIEKKKLHVVKTPDVSTTTPPVPTPVAESSSKLSTTADGVRVSIPVSGAAKGFTTENTLKKVPVQSQHMTELNTIANNINLEPTYKTLKELLSFQNGQPINKESEAYLASDEYKKQSIALIDELTFIQRQLAGSIDNGEPFSMEVPDFLIAKIKRSDFSAQLYNEFQYARDIISKLFNAINNDQWLNQPVKNLLALLQIPLLKVTILYKDFFETWSNPARTVFNKLAMVDFDNEKNHFYIKAKSFVLYILRNFEQELEVFTKIENVLSQLLELQSNHYNKKINFIIRKWDAQQVVTNELASRLAGHSIPVAVADFISYQWLPVLVSTYLGKGTDSSQWLQYLQALDMLVLSLTGDVSDDFIDSDVILFVIKQGLDENNLNNKKVIDDIESFLKYGGKGRRIELSRDVIVKLLINGYALSDKTALAKITRGMTDATILASKAIALRLKVNDYVSFKQENQTTRLQFIWGSDNQNVFVFAGRTGQQAAVFNLIEVAAMFENGVMSQTKDYELPILERCLYSIVGDIHDNIAYQSHLDPLTGFIDRKEFERLLIQQLRINKDKGPECALCLINIDSFGLINDTCGFEAGDHYLAEISREISQILPDKAVIARFGIDEFAIMLPHHGQKKAQSIAETHRNLINNFSFKWHEKQFTLSASIGLVIVSEYNEAALYIKAMVTAANIAKELGRNRIHLLEYDALELNHRQELQLWATRIDQMIKNNRLDIRGQRLHPILDESLNPHYEMLLLVKDEQGNTMPPAEFIEAAELYNKMADVDRWVIENVLNWYSNNPELLRQLGGVAINLSGHSLNDVDFLGFIQDVFSRYSVAPELICFEITETVAVTNMNHAINIIHAIKELGCEFSLDDFGTGQSSYAYLKNLPVDYLKIDGFFIKDIANNPTDQAMVKSINEIGHFLGMKTVAEYVENEEIVAVLKEIGVDYAQGFGIEKPMLIKEHHKDSMVL